MGCPACGTSTGTHWPGCPSYSGPPVKQMTDGEVAHLQVEAFRAGAVFGRGGFASTGVKLSDEEILERITYAREVSKEAQRSMER